MNIKEIDISAFSPHLFWDVDTSQLQLNKHIRFVVKKVLIYGFYNDWKIIFSLYGKQTIFNEAKTIKELDLKTACLLASISETPITEFLCYTTIQSNPKHWNF